MTNKRLILYSFGSTGLNILNFYFVNKIAFVYDSKAGNTIIPLSLMTILLGTSRLLDAFSDPFIGWKNDRLKHLGKSNWFLYGIGIPLACFSFWWIWHPPLDVLGKGWPLHLWFLIVVNLYFIAYTLVAIPYDAYLVEMAKGEKDRVKASSAKAFFAILGLGGGVYWISHQDISLAATALSIVAFVSFLIALGGMHFFPSAKPLKKSPALNKSKNLKQILKASLNNKLLCFFLGFILITEMMGALFIKYLEYFVHHLLLPLVTQSKQTIIPLLYGSFILAMVIGIFLWNHLAKKKPASFWLKRAILGLIFLLPHYYWIGYAPVLPPLLQAVAFFFLAGLFYAALPILTVVELARVCDLEENQQQEKVHSLYFGLYAFCRKLSLVGGLVCLTIIIESFTWGGNVLLGYRFMGPAMAILLIIALWILKAFVSSQKSEHF